ncbi:MarR family transcriptional regulator [Gudongella oleilytica]|uniref:MarR family transcriptional regulator n=1 Tax=Gudongella oleilytica TaxID=1582259 RepID=UPI002A3698F3|nr:MarR family transcriptional regulator [Gudongella oleilytica]MDY0257368.1 MarR family transcriptional regulator [Gudongella oleilytica]
MDKKLMESLVRSRKLDVFSMSVDDIGMLFDQINQSMLKIYKFVLTYNDYMNSGHEYSDGIPMSMMEAHILTDICDNENMTVTTLAENWERSKSATSQTVRKLMSKGLIQRKESEDSGKVFHLSPTERGKKISDDHKRYDVLDTIKTLKVLNRELSVDEILIMFNSLELYKTLLKNRDGK